VTVRDEAKQKAMQSDPSHPSHGTMSGYQNWRCRCDRCRKAKRAYRDDPARWGEDKRARAERALVAFVRDDLPNTQIAERYGITGGTLGSDLRAIDPTLYLLAKRRRLARRRLQRFVDRGTVQCVHSCHLCGEAFTGPEYRRYCSPVHQSAAMSLRFQTDEHFRVLHLGRVAKWHIANVEDNEVLVRHAKRRLAGTTRTHGRWLVPGSVPFHWALKAHALGWPIWDRFHPEVQQQIREWVGSESESAA
jgi:hypothetical protein